MTARDDKRGAAVHKGKLMDAEGWQDTNAQEYVAAADYEALRQRFERACAEITRLSAPSHVAPKREWEGYCSAEVEETVKEIDKIFGDGKMTDTSRDWGQMCAIASMVVRVRAAVKAEYAPSTTERSDAALRACDGLSTLDLAGNKRGWLAELCYDAHKLDEPHKAGAEKCLKIVKEMRATALDTDGVDYGILSRVEYRLQKVMDMPVAPAPASVASATRRTVTSEMVDRFLRWPLPPTVCADTCASMPNYQHQRSGTNLLNADESRQMLEFVLGEGSDRDGDRYRYLFTKGGLVAALSERFGCGGYEQTSKATIDAAIDDALLRAADGGVKT